MNHSSQTNIAQNNSNIAQMTSDVELNDEIMGIKAKCEKLEDKYAIITHEYRT